MHADEPVRPSRPDSRPPRSRPHPESPAHTAPRGRSARAPAQSPAPARGARGRCRVGVPRPASRAPDTRTRSGRRRLRRRSLEQPGEAGHFPDSGVGGVWRSAPQGSRHSPGGAELWARPCEDSRGPQRGLCALGCWLFPGGCAEPAAMRVGALPPTLLQGRPVTRDASCGFSPSVWASGREVRPA